MRNMNELIAELSDVFAGLKDGSITPDIATELNNTCGKIINATKVQLLYATLRNESPEIKFLNGGNPLAAGKFLPDPENKNAHLLVSASLET